MTWPESRRALSQAIPARTRQGIGVAGIILFEVGFALTQVSFKGGTLPQWNGLCGLGARQVLGLTPQDCALAAHVDHLIGWMIGQGLVFLTGFVILWLASLKPSGTADLAEPTRR